MIFEHNLVGAMDFDSPDHQIDPRLVREARNVIWRGSNGNMRAESVVGTTIIPNPYLPNTGVNKCIGAAYDDINNLLFDFNFNSLGTSGIYIYNTVLGSWTTLIQLGTNTVGDPLGFTASGRISGVKIIYGDATDGNLLFFLNSYGVPTKMNIKKYLTAPPTGIQRSYIEVIKAPPKVPPRVVYENDTTVKANNLVNSLFQFAYTFIYDHFEESVISSGSQTPLPLVPFSNTLNTDKTSCSRIAVYLQTGDQSVKKIRLYMRQTQNGVTSGWFIVDTIVKSDSAIPDNSIYRYAFFNTGNYIPADPAYTVLLQDQVPLKANCQELLNGDTISYGGITEGYDWFKSQFSYNLSSVPVEDLNYIVNGVLFFADYTGTYHTTQPIIQIVLTGTGTNDPITGMPTTLTQVPQNYYVRAKSGSTDISFSYFSAGQNIISTVLSNISAAAVSAGWTVASAPTGNAIFLYYPTGNVTIQATRIENRYLAVNNPGYQCALYPQSNYSLGIVYYDQYGRTNGVITDITANIGTRQYNYSSPTTVTQVTLNLNGVIPPSWAAYYHVVKTNTLTYSKALYWVSNSAVSNIGQLVDNQYAYIGISNIEDYNLSIQATQGVVGYEFAAGDRVMINGVYAVNGTYTSLNYDYSVLGVAVNPVINGTTHLGSFIKIAYPTADIAANPNYKFDGSPDFQNYFIFLYSIASNTTSSNRGSTNSQGNVYYEFGQQYFIGNSGLNTAYHMGNLADNQVIFNDGDCFARQRTVPAGCTYFLNSAAVAFSGPWLTPALSLNPTGNIVTSQYTVGSEVSLAADPINAANFPRFSDTGGIFQNTTSGITARTYNVRLRGSFSISSSFVTWISLICKIVGPGGQVMHPYILAHSDSVGDSTNVQTINIEFDGTVPVPAGYKLWLILGNGEINVGTTNSHFGGFQLRMDVVNNITIDVFEPSFSDVYNIVTSNNSRALVQDTTAAQTYNSTLYRWSLNYQVGTTIDNTCRFYPLNFDEFDKSHGDIIRLRSRQREVRVFQKRRCGHIGVYAKFIKDNAGTNILVTTDNIITPNNIEYYEGEFGIGNQPDALCSSGFQDYFADPVKGYFCRLSQDGITALSELYKMQTFAGENLPNYLNTDYVYQYGGNAVILASYHFSKDRASEAIFVLQGGTRPSGSLVGQSIAFREEGNAWSSMYDYAPDTIICCENDLYSFSNGALYKHDNQNAYCNFYNTQYKPSVSLIKNEYRAIDKTWIGVSLVSNTKWVAPLVYTDSYSYPGQVQESNIVESDYSLVEGHYRASLRNDINSIGGIANGQRLKGALIFLEFTVTDGSKFATLSNIAIKSIASQLVQK